MNNKEKYVRDLLSIIQHKLSTDILAETFAALLLHSDYQLSYSKDLVHLIPKNHFQRNYRPDITDIQIDDEWESDDVSSPDLIKIFTSRSSILDNLPETIFWDPDSEKQDPEAHNSSENEQKTDLTKEEKKERERERKRKAVESANKFFIPLEVAYNQVRISKESKELQLIQDFGEILLNFWKTFTDKFDFLDIKELLKAQSDAPKSHKAWSRFLRTLHLVSYVVGDRKKTQELVSFVLGKPISLQEEIVTEAELPDDLKGKMGEFILGYNFNVGNVFKSFTRVCIIHIGGIESDEFYEYYKKNSETSKLLNEIMNYYFPLDVQVRFEFKVQPAESNFVLNDSGEGAPILGYFSTL